MKRSFSFVFCLYLIGINPLFGQIDSFPEKIYLNTDRNVYSSGDTIWLSGWVLDAGTLLPVSKSRMLHVELIAPDNRIARHVVLDAYQGIAPGQFSLPAGMVSDGLYRLRAYTRWSLNFGKNCRFEKIIPIVQFKEDIWKGPRKHETKRYEWARLPNGRFDWIRKRNLETSTRISQAVDSLPPIDLQFFPEGGRWISGQPSHMAFKAITSDGKGVNVYGEIIDETGAAVASFASMHRGMGSVSMVPELGKRYSARLFTGHLFELPQPDTSGVVMSVLHKAGDLLVRLDFTPEQAGENFRLTAFSRGIPSGEWLVRACPHVVMHIRKADFHTGILRLTLFTKEGLPCNERMVFIDRKDGINFEVIPEQIAPGWVKLGMCVSDGYGLPIQGVFTVTVTDTMAGYRPGDPCLRSQMLLSSDLKGVVENPGWYFSVQRDSSLCAALDLVMLTNGWGGYSREKIANIQYEHQKLYTLSGTVFNLRNKPAKGISVTLFGQGAETIVADTITGADGKFRFERLFPWENTLVSVMAKHKKGKKSGLGLGVQLDKQPDAPSPGILSLAEYGDSRLWNSLADRYRHRKLDEDRLTDSLLRDKDIHFIEEVIIEGVRPVRGSFNLNGPGMADRVLYQEDIERYDRYDRLIDIFKAEFPQFELSSCPGSEAQRSYGFKVKNIPGGKMIPFEDQYAPVRHISDRPVLFFLNGRASQNLWDHPANDITGIELMDSPEYLWPYIYDPVYDSAIRPFVIEITTRSGRSDLQHPSIGTATVNLRGFTVPRQFYVPKYNPENVIDQADFDMRPVLFRDPEVVTDREGKAEITFPVGLKPRGLQIRVEGTDLQGGIGSTVQGISVNEGNNHQQP
ncbi:MAG: hypothetical protein LBL04_13395 [Bacteroidales bacterium]|nr:hypothetical protein [Bacteroidales bacterium]